VCSNCDGICCGVCAVTVMVYVVRCECAVNVMVYVVGCECAVNVMVYVVGCECAVTVMVYVVGCECAIGGRLHSSGALRCIDWLIVYGRFDATHRSHFRY